MPRKKRRRRKGLKYSGKRLMFFEELAGNGFHLAFHHHIEELAYEMLKDPEYQKWMQQWAEGFFSALLRGLRSKRAAEKS